jgi:hypothetical protein
VPHATLLSEAHVQMILNGLVDDAQRCNSEVSARADTSV